jgi:hypothetical protein
MQVGLGGMAHHPILAAIFWDWPGDTEVVMARKPG